MKYFMFCSFNSSVAIWIIGSSIVQWVHDFAVKSSQSDLGLRSANILWHGIRGMVWEHLRPALDFLLIGIIGTKISLLFIGRKQHWSTTQHSKGNSNDDEAVLAEIKRAITKLHDYWFHIHVLQRRHWSNVVANLEAEKCRRRINSSIASFILKKLGGICKSRKFKPLRWGFI